MVEDLIVIKVLEIFEKGIELENCLKSICLLKISCLILDSTKTIRLLALNFYEMIVDSGFALIDYHLIEISSS